MEGCKRALEKIDELEKKAMVSRLKKAFQRRSEQICREHGIVTKPGVILHCCECGGNLRVLKKK